MCGISGLLNYPTAAKLDTTIRAMTSSMSHRGPDDAGLWLDQQYGLAMGQQRLAVIDVSPAGHQPMQSGDGRYMMAFNGEIYNHRQLREALEHQGLSQWRGHSDSEILLAGFVKWGITATLKRCTGMFAIALWDRQQHKLHLIRDRVGEKPLYHGYIGNCFAFASELKALRTLDIFDKSVDRHALNSYLHYGYIPAPQSIYQGISKLKPGTMLTLDYRKSGGEQTTQIIEWWSFIAMAQQAQQQLITDKNEARERLQNQLQQSISQQACADVAVGAFLSGGIDSTTIINQLSQSGTQPIKTFTVGFRQNGYNEAEQAKAIAQFLGTEHHEIYVNAGEAREVIPLLPDIYDEPFADTSQIPTYLIARYAKQSVTVALSGDAGDELFGGYSSYLHSPAIWNKVRRLPLPLRNFGAHLLSRIKPAYWNRLASQLGSHKLSGNNLHKLGNSLQDCYDLEDFFIRLGLQLPESESLVIGSNDFQAIRPPINPGTNSEYREDTMMLGDSLNGLPDDILCKVDRAAMAVSLETRVPFLDHHLIELAWRLPLSMKIQNGQGKQILRDLLYQDIPAAILNRPKQGFNVPVEHWLKHELRDWAESLLSEKRLVNEGYLHAGKIRHQWQLFLSGKRANQQLLWNILMFQAWQERWRPSRSP